MGIPVLGSLSKPLSELKIDPNWCFDDQNRFSAFYKTSTLQPVENRKEDFEKNPSRDTFSGKDSAHSNAFWLTHWSVRLGLHSMITEMNSHLSQYLNQLTREIRNAERSGDETKKKRLEIAAHYILIKIYTGEGYHQSVRYKTIVRCLEY